MSNDNQTQTELISGTRSSNANAVGAANDYVEIATWEENGEFYGCLQGIEAGLYWDSDDVGPYKSRQEARDAAADLLADD